MGIRSTCADMPLAGFSTRPLPGALTSGVLSLKPGSVGAPSEAMVRPRSRAAPLAGARAAARSRPAMATMTTRARKIDPRDD